MMSTQSACARILIYGFLGVAAVGANIADGRDIRDNRPPTTTSRADPWDDEVEFLTGNDAMNTYTADSHQVNGQPQNISGGRNSSGIGKSCNNPGVQCR